MRLNSTFGRVAGRGRREINAVNSEFQKNLENDGWREWALGNTRVRPGHPAGNFNIGSRETLQGTTRAELLAALDADPDGQYSAYYAGCGGGASGSGIRACSSRTPAASVPSTPGIPVHRIISMLL